MKKLLALPCIICLQKVAAQNVRIGTISCKWLQLKIETIKEQQKQIDELKKSVEKLLNK